MINDTYELRKKYGKFHQVDEPENVRSFHHACSCEACGSSKPERLIAVSSENGQWAGMVGSTCAGILCSSKIPSGECYRNQRGLSEVQFWCNFFALQREARVEKWGKPGTRVGKSGLQAVEAAPQSKPKCAERESFNARAGIGSECQGASCASGRVGWPVA